MDKKNVLAVFHKLKKTGHATFRSIGLRRTRKYGQPHTEKTVKHKWRLLI